MAVEMERKGRLINIINTTLEEVGRCYSSEGVAWRISPRYLVWLSEWMVMLSNKIRNRERAGFCGLLKVFEFQFG